MKQIEPLLGGAILLESPIFSDERGSFTKFFHHKNDLENYQISQVNFVQNDKTGTLRGLHYQTGEHVESKFFRVLNGQINLVFLDLNPSSPTYRQSASYTLDNPTKGILIPRGFATGYEVLVPNTDVLYFSDRPYVPGAERGIHWHDPMVQSMWITETPIVSDKDQKWKLWED